VTSSDWKENPIAYAQATLWNKPHLTWRLDTTAGVPSNLKPDELLAEIDASFKVWERAGVFSFSQAGDEPADIVLRFTDPPGEKFDGHMGKVAKAYFPWAQNRGEIYLDPEERWSTKRFALTRETVFDWLPHQIGHVLGLKDTTYPSRFVTSYGPYGTPDAWALSDLRHLYVPPRATVVMN